MYVGKLIGVRVFLAETWKINLSVLVTVTLATVVYLEILQPHLRISLAVVTVLGTAISFFIGFINAQAYDRWWEARKIWGSFVNDSRSFARMVRTLFDKSNDADQVATLQDRLIRRHIAYLYAVKEHLRKENSQEYLGHLSERDAGRIATLAHKGNALLELQGEDIDAAERSGYIDVIRMAQLNNMLTDFSTSMGMAERIKTTVFPVFYASLVRLSIWVFLLTFPVALSQQLGYWAILYAFLLGAIFRLTFLAGEILENPFEGRPADTPMSSIVRTIEINLLEQIGERNLPPPVEPVEGRYLL